MTFADEFLARMGVQPYYRLPSASQGQRTCSVLIILKGLEWAHRP